MLISEIEKKRKLKKLIKNLVNYLLVKKINLH